MLEYASGANPQGLRAPSPRPDYALFQGTRLLAYLDAKYRDIWQKRLPSKWLYQLSIYAIASPSRVSVLLYPSHGESAADARIVVRQPLAATGGWEASVLCRPVDLLRLALVLSEGGDQQGERSAFASQLVSLSTSSVAGGINSMFT